MHTKSKDFVESSLCFCCPAKLTARKKIRLHLIFNILFACYSPFHMSFWFLLLWFIDSFSSFGLCKANKSASILGKRFSSSFSNPPSPKHILVLSKRQNAQGCSPSCACVRVTVLSVDPYVRVCLCLPCVKLEPNPLQNLLQPFY